MDCWRSLVPVSSSPDAQAAVRCGQGAKALRFHREKHYNYFRDYDPAVGRYIQSDPVGLDGGINTYSYVGGRPLTVIDPLGLDNPGMGPYCYPNPSCRVIWRSTCRRVLCSSHYKFRGGFHNVGTCLLQQRILTCSPFYEEVAVTYKECDWGIIGPPPPRG